MSRKWQDEIKRSLDYAGTSGVLIQPEVDKIVAEIIEYKNPLRQNIPRKQRNSDAWLLNRRSAAAANTVAQWVNDLTEPAIDRTEQSRITFQFRTLLARGKVTRFAQDAGRSYIDVLSEEIEARARAFKDLEENAMLYGNNSVTTTQPDGLTTLITGAQIIEQTATAGGAALTLTKIDETVDQCAGAPDIMIASKQTRRKLNALLQADQRFVNTTEVAGGFRVLSYDDIPIFASTNVTNNFWFDGTQVVGTTGDTSHLFVIDTSEFWVGYMNDVTVSPLSKTSSQFDQFDIYEDVAFVMRSTIHHAMLVGFDNQ
jgi:hypothetical protein